MIFYPKPYSLSGIFGKLAMIIDSTEELGLLLRFINVQKHICTHILKLYKKKKLQQLYTSQEMKISYLLPPPIILVRPTLMQVPAEEKH